MTARGNAVIDKDQWTQKVTTGSQSNGSTTTATVTPATTTTGNTLLAFVWSNLGSAPTMSGLTGATWASLGNYDLHATIGRLDLMVATGYTGASSPTITGTWGSNVVATITAIELNGVQGHYLVDAAFATSTGSSSTTVAPPLLTLTQGSELVFTFFMTTANLTSTVFPGAPWETFGGGSGTKYGGAFIHSGQASYANSNFTQGMASGSWMAAAISFDAPASIAYPKRQQGTGETPYQYVATPAAPFQRWAHSAPGTGEENNQGFNFQRWLQMSRKFQTIVDMQGNAIENATLQPQSAAPNSPQIGQVYWDESRNQIGIWSGSGWYYVTMSGAPTFPIITQGMIGANLYDFADAQFTYQPTAGYVYLMEVTAFMSGTVDHLVYDITSAGSGLTSSENFVGLYDTGQTSSTLATLLAQSADQTSAWGGTGVNTTALTTSPNVTVGNTYYAAFLSNGSSPPTFAAIGAPVALINTNLTLKRFGIAGAGSTHTLPSTITLSTISNPTGAIAVGIKS